MLDAKDILVKLKGDNKQFKGAMTGANTSMKGFAATTATSSAAAATSTKAMAISMASSMAIATAGITLVIGGVVALAGALKAAVQGASDDADVTIQTTALLKQQGVAWNDVSDAVNTHVEALQNLTGYADTELQESFNEFLSAGMNVEEALKSMDAAAAISASGQMELSAASGVLRRQFQSGTSRLKNYGIEAENFEGILKGVNDTFGDGSQRAETFEGKMGVLTEAIMDQLKPLGAQLLPIMTDVLDLFIWGAQNVLPPLIRGFQILMIPIKGVIMNLKSIYEVAKAAWAALTGDWEAAETHWNNVGKLQKDFNKELKDTVRNVKDVSDATGAIIPVLTEGVEEGIGGATITGQVSGQSLGMQYTKMGITPEEYSGFTFGINRRGEEQTTQEKWQKIEEAEKDKVSDTVKETSTEVVENIEKQTATLNEYDILIHNELKVHTSLLGSILNKIEKPKASVFGGQNSGA